MRIILSIVLIGFLLSFQNSNNPNSPKKIRVSKGYIDKNGNLYNDRIYIDQFEFDIENKTISKRKNESKEFKKIEKVDFPELLLKSETIDEILEFKSTQIDNPCNIPIKSHFYKIDFLYCNRYPTYIESFEIDYIPSESKNYYDKTIMEKIIDEYLKYKEKYK
jgi:hypothetical protein